jgi:hypothetical protein
MPRSGNYRTKALQKYPASCVWCGFGIRDVLEVAHLNHDPSDDDIGNLAVLCPTCHRMYDLGMLPEETVRYRRNHPPKPDWTVLQQDGPAKALATRKRRAAARKAAATRRKKANR